MKNIRYYILLLVFLFVYSCEEKNRYHLPDEDEYSYVYMIQAVDNPRYIRISMLQDEVQTAYYSAFYSGVVAPDDINIKFEIDIDLVATYNEINQTNYKVMPEGSYILEDESAMIPKGESRSNLMKIGLRSFGYMEAFEEYLLPLVMRTDDVRMNEELSVIYFLISASYAPGQIPKRLVCDNVTNAIEMFSYRDKSLFTRSADGKVRSYPYDIANKMFGDPNIIANDWTYASVPYIASAGLNNKKIAVVDGAWSMWIADWDEEGSTPLPEPNNFDSFSRWLFSTGLGIFNRVIWTSRNDGVLGKWGNGSGAVQYYKFTDDWTSYASVSTTSYVGWDSQKVIFVYNGDFITIDSAGNMWMYKFSSDNIIGSPTKIGSGWDIYTHVTPFGNNLIARDATGKLWEYEFDPRGFWAL
jgi:hypothetical protein